MIAIFTDFGWEGPYVGQMKAQIARIAPDEPVIDLMHDAPAFDPRPSAYLLAALLDHLPRHAIVCAVVDPGVGSERPAVLAQADGRRLVGPGNGLFAIALRRADYAEQTRLTREPVALSATFHGRDLFAPAAARLARGDRVPTAALEADLPGGDWPSALAEIIYLDGYGNAMTGLPAAELEGSALIVGGRRLRCLRTFSDAEPGEAFWYPNSIGLAEIAVNQGSAVETLGLERGSRVRRA